MREAGIKLQADITPSLAGKGTQKPHQRHFTSIDDSPMFRCSEGFGAASAPAFTEIWQQLVDGLSEQVALVDADWNILLCNNAWTRAVEFHGQFTLGPGVNYLEFLRRHARDGYFAAHDTLAGLEEIIAGNRNSYRMIYSGADHWTGRDTEVFVRRFEVNGHKFGSVTRYDVTPMLELRKLREEFSASVMHEQADERRRIGREIHDSTGQLLTALGLTIGLLRRTSEVAGVGDILKEMEQLLGQAHQEIRSVSYLVHPPVLGKLTLAEALRAFVEGFARRTGLDFRFELLDEPRMCCPAAEEAIYRVVQEALSNVHRHSNARHATVRLSQGRAVSHVVIADDGIGISNETLSGNGSAGVGLAGMGLRLSEIGGRLSVRHLNPGTAIIASVPSDRVRTPEKNEGAQPIPTPRNQVLGNSQGASVVRW